MKALKLSFDFSDKPELVQLLRTQAVETGRSQKAVLLDALETYFAEKLENRMLVNASEKTFAEWNNEEDRIYDDL